MHTHTNRCAINVQKLVDLIDGDAARHARTRGAYRYIREPPDAGYAVGLEHRQAAGPVPHAQQSVERERHRLGEPVSGGLPGGGGLGEHSPVGCECVDNIVHADEMPVEYGHGCGARVAHGQIPRGPAEGDAHGLPEPRPAASGYASDSERVLQRGAEDVCLHPVVLEHLHALVGRVGRRDEGEGTKILLSLNKHKIKYTHKHTECTSHPLQ
jgi:hypothetical protein